jgi:hypothetical protein
MSSLCLRAFVVFFSESNTEKYKIDFIITQIWVMILDLWES